MVNTRRMESNGSGPYNSHRYRTRGSNERRAEVESSGDNASESEESQGEEDTWNSQDKRKKQHVLSKSAPLPPRVRELRSRFVCNEFKFDSHHLRNSSTKNCHKRERHSLSVFNHKMRNELGTYDSEDDCYSPRRTRHLRHRGSIMGRVERRTALSLRPLIAKSYVDRSPLTCNSDDSDVGLRRSARQRKFQYQEVSWITDQMPKKGYPNAEYSEDDSRDAQEECDTNTRCLTDNSRRGVRNELNGIITRREIKKNTKYHDYETTEVNINRRPINDEKDRTKTNRLLRSHRDLYNRDNKDNHSLIPTRINRRLSKGNSEKQESDNKEDDAPEDENDDDKVEEELVEEAINNVAIQKRDDKIERSEKDSNALVKKVTTRKGTKMEDSSTSSEEGRVYLLRDRPPKPSTSALIETKASRIERLRPRRRFGRTRSPTSSDTSDSEERCRNKYSKNVKTTHQKNEQPLKSGAGGSKVIPIGPEMLDAKIRFNSVGGLDSHIQCLKEMILLPMMYPEVFDKFQIQPPRGVLFYGPPGTGKTLVARALANECCFGSRKISFFMRKGADLLSKWIGESEKQLRLLFEQAAEMKPSIIFFDELDGLAPVRSSRQDQIHASIVSTLLALMDGLDNRGEVIVIGATNRIDAIDPALRRPGRFDRELFFPLPSKKEREEILRVYVSQWSIPPSSQLLSYLAENAIGYCGSDLKALCSEAVIQSFRRTYPQVYNADYKLLLNPDDVKVEEIDFLRAKSQLVPSSHRSGQRLGRKLLLILKPLLEQAFTDIMSILQKTFPHGVNPKLAKVKLSANVHPAQLILVGDSAQHGQTAHLAPAILYDMEHIRAQVLDLTTLYGDSNRSPEETCVQVFHELRRNVPSVLYIPAIDQWWNLISDTLKAIFFAQLSQLDPNSPILLFATASSVYENLPFQIQNIFSPYRNEIYELRTPSEEQRRNFFQPLLKDTCLKQPRAHRQTLRTPPPLPKAPTPPPTPLSEAQRQKVFEMEEHTLRELRIFLREICKKLANNRLFYMFTKPVDTEEVPDYPSIIKQPMDLETMMTKVDFHHYECAKDFLKDIELIVQNALEYNPAKTSVDKQIRHRACSLRDYAFTLIKNEMDSDFEEKCQDISKNRKKRNASVAQYLPPFLQTMDYAGEGVKKTLSTETENSNSKDTPKDTSPVTPLSIRTSPCRKRKLSNWQKGLLNNKKKRRKEVNETSQVDERISEDEVKCNEVSCVTASTSEAVSSMQVSDDSQDIVNSKADNTTLLTIDCDTTSTSKFVAAHSLESPNSKRKLSDLLSPSELLEHTLDFDDIDRALKHDFSDEGARKMVEIDTDKLDQVLEKTVDISNDRPLQCLLDLHSQLRRIIDTYSRFYSRNNLPNDLEKELVRYTTEVNSKINP